MVDLKYLKMKRTKKVASIVTLVTGVLLIPFMLLSFMGRDIGHFTIGLKNSNVKLALSTDIDFKESTTFMSLDKLPPYTPYTIEALNSVSDVVLDDPSSNDTIGKKVNPHTNNAEYLYFFKYTFYLKNVGDVNASYNFKFSIVDNKRPTNVNYSLDDILRVRFYENSNLSEHNYVTYAKEGITPHFNEGSIEPFYNTCVNKETGSFCDEYGFATNFESETIILSNDINHFKIGDVTRYTVVLYLESNDKECEGEMPDETYLKLAINIEAFEEVNEE